MQSRLQRPRKLSKVQAKLAAARLKPVPLRVAASLLHRELGGRGRSAMLGPEYINELNAAAAQLSQVVDIYVLNAGGAMTLVRKHELAGAEFLDGGNVVRTVAGTQHRRLALRRGEAIAAINFLINETAET